MIFSVEEQVVLELAARQADDLAALERMLAEQGLVVAGSKGQPKLSGAPAELRAQRAALAKLVSQLAIPMDGELVGRTPAQRKAARAAAARWERRRGLSA